MIVIIDYGLGNLRSLSNAFKNVGIDPLITADPTAIKKAAGIVIPGVGAFGAACLALQNLNLFSVLQESIYARKPVLGICLGMQLLFSTSEEHGIHKGLGVIDGAVKKMVVVSPLQKLPLAYQCQVYDGLSASVS